MFDIFFPHFLAVFVIDDLIYIALAVSLIGAGVSAYGTYEAGQQQEEAQKKNAQIAQNAAANEQAVAAENAARQREENKRRLGTIKARMAASGIQTGAGSALDVLGESASELELQTLDAFNASDNRQRQYETQAAMDTFAGNNAASAGTISAGGSLLSGIGSAASGYYGSQKYQTSGVIRTGSH